LRKSAKPVDLSLLKGLHDIETVVLSGQNVANDGLLYLSRLPRLRQLDVSWTPVGDQGLVHLQDVRSLTELDLSSTSVTDSGLGLLKKLTQLRRLILNDTAVSDIGLAHLSENGELREIELRGTRVDGSGLDTLATSIVRLDMSRSLAKDSTISSLSRLSRLEYLALKDTRVTNQVCSLLKDMDRLKAADLSWSFATKAGVASTASLLNVNIVVDTRESDRDIDEIRKVVEATDGVDKRILGFSHKENGQVRVFTGVNRGHLNGDGDLLILEKKEGKWSVVSIGAWSS
jgi:hypothetical protein